MSQALDLLNSLTETVVDHKHVVPDSDTYFIIDPYTRQIENTNYQKTVLMRGDHNSERFTFELPRYVDGHDMSLCNRVIVHFDNVGDSIENVYSDVAYMDDLRINPDKPDTVISSWLIRREATQIVGLLSFSLQYQCVEGDEVTYEWNTDSCDEIEIRKSKSNGEAAIIKYTNVLEEWRAKIFGAGDSVMSNITTEGANQVAAVQNESATQQAAIELKGSETLATIPDDYTEVYNMATEAVRTKADGIVCEAEGSAITIDDASNDYIRGLKVYGKSTQVVTNGYQLFNAYAERNESFANATVENSGAKITVTGSYYVSWPITLKAGVEYYIDFRVAENAEYRAVRFEYPDKEITNTITNPTVFTPLQDTVSVYLYAGLGTEGSVVYENVQITEGSTAVSWEPYTGGVPSPNPEYPQEIVSIENPIVEACGENLARSSRDGNIASMGLTVTQFNNSSEIIINGTTTAATSITVFRDICLPVGQYTLSVYGLNVMNTSYDRAYVMDGSSVANVNYVQPDRPQTFNITKPSVVSISIVFAETSSYHNQTVKFQLERGSAATEYKPYSGKRIALTHTLHGIPVTSGGNYTDENGQQWICDEVDLERGVYVQRIFNKTFTDFGAATNYSVDDKGTSCAMVVGTQLVPTKGMCSHLPLTINTTGSNRFNPIDGVVYFKLEGNMLLEELKAKLTEMSPTVNAILVTPIETPLTAEEIETYKTLKTNYPNTTVLNDSGAWMKVKYNADIKRQLEDVKSHLTVATSPARIGTVTLLAAEWEGSDNLYHQIVDIEGVTENSQVDLTPGIDQLAIFYNKDLSFVTENDRGVVTVYAIGQKPTSDYTIQVTITEVQL